MFKSFRAILVGLIVDYVAAMVIYIPVALIFTLILSHGTPGSPMSGKALVHSLPFVLLTCVAGFIGHLVSGYLTVALDPKHRLGAAWTMIALRILCGVYISALYRWPYPLWYFLLAWLLGPTGCWVGARFYLARAEKSQLSPIATIPPIAAP